MLNFGELIEELKLRYGYNNSNAADFLEVSKSLLLKYLTGESYPKYNNSMFMLEKMGVSLKIDYGRGAEDFDYDKFRKFISDNIDEYGLLRMELRTGMSTATLNRTRYKKDVNLNLKTIDAMATGMKLRIWFEKSYEKTSKVELINQSVF